MTESGSMPRAKHVPLARVRDDRFLAGVCGGLAAHLGVPVIWVRVGMLAFTLLGGAGALFYVWLWVTVPLSDATSPDDLGNGVQRMRRALTSAPASAGPNSSTPPPAHSANSALPAASAGAHSARPDPQTKAATPPGFTRWPVAELLLGGALLIAGLGLVLTQLGVELDLAIMLPAMVVLVGVGLTWWQIADRDRPERNLLPRVLGALALVAAGVLTFFVTASQPSVFTVIAAALAVLAGVALALAPWLLRINRELINERSARAREAERSDIAAHLHDSVLQTLAAIQQRSEPGSDVARLARGQERELREWLFRGADGAEGLSREAADVELRAHAAALEAEYAVRFEVVSVGSSVIGSNAVGSSSVLGEGSAVPEPMVAAAREAMLNAAKHAGGEVSVYIEVSPGRASIDVMDRGPGLGAAFDSPRNGSRNTAPDSKRSRTIDADELPDGRMGVRESIIGRMERAGGTANLVPGPGGKGTSVRLAMPLPESEEDAE